MENLVNVARIAGIVLIAVFCSWASWEHHEAVKYKDLCVQYIEQMNQLQAEAKKANEDANVAWDMANKAMKAASEKQQKIMKENVSKDCEKAMKWGYEQRWIV